MASLDISIVFFALMISMILDILAFGMRVKWFYGISMLFAISSLGYFISNYQVVSIGSFTIPFQIFIISWICLPVLVPFILIVRKRL